MLKLLSKNSSLVFLGCFVASWSGCKHSSSKEASPSIPNGTYSASAVVCVGSGAAPQYPDVTKKALIHDFADLTFHTLQLADNLATELFVTSDCTLKFDRELFANSGDRFGFRDTRRATFTPEGCQMKVKFQDGTYPFGLSSGIFAERTQSGSEEIPFNIEPIENGFKLLSLSTPSLQEVWKQYGCSASDRISFDLIGI